MKNFLLAIFFLMLAATGEAKDMTTTKQETAVFAGGCFWCMEKPFDQTKGVLSTEAGYIGGHVANPTYEQVSSGQTGHMEAMRVVYDPSLVDYQTLLTVFWHNVDPFDPQGQFCDKGDQYRSAIFYENEEQRKLAETSKQQVAAQLGHEVVTEVLAAAPFYPAEEYHQNYYVRNPIRYHYYRYRCGRDERLARVWGESKE